MKVSFNKISLKTLSALEGVDKNTVSICEQNGLLNLEKIIQYYLKNGNFLNLKKGNTACNQLLTSLCEKYLSNQYDSESINESIIEIIEEIDSNVMNPKIENANNSFDVIGKKDFSEAIVNGDDSKKENPILDELSQDTVKASTKSVDELEGLCEINGNFKINPPSNNSLINRIDEFSVNQLALFNCIVRYRFTLSVSSSDAIPSTRIGVNFV